MGKQLWTESWFWWILKLAFMVKPNTGSFGIQVCVQQIENIIIPLLHMEIYLGVLCIAVQNPYKWACKRASIKQELGRWYIIQDRSPQSIAHVIVKKLDPQNILVGVLSSLHGPRFLAVSCIMHWKVIRKLEARTAVSVCNCCIFLDDRQKNEPQTTVQTSTLIHMTYYWLI